MPGVRAVDKEIAKIQHHIESIDCGIKQLNQTLSELLAKLLPHLDDPDLITSSSTSHTGDRHLVTLAELSQLTGIPKKTLHNWTAPGVKHSPLGFSPIRSGRKKYFKREDINKFLNVSKEK